jgi:hypothetical protein
MIVDRTTTAIVVDSTADLRTISHTIPTSAWSL